ncbi:hypothetical protein SCHIN_v1c06790 [Spiroplasma chinense]|uniref:Uncharacterized protein n=1 Tax=Spiroplasma chinense TaxID=216932 RepID=A0A5B9Y591_9MOLU|nr:hypothetical protein [Spiroplasma chinense]QEH61876.1 hypothetical protein SCHIN_v1c06790 [Spiroplasma chinense]
MGIKNLKELNSEVSKFSANSINDIKKHFMIEFVKYFYKTKFNQDFGNQKNYLTKGFCDFLTFNYVNSFLTSSFDKNNFKLISDYLKTSKFLIEKKNIRNVLIITAKKVDKFDKNITDFVNEITQTNKWNVKIRNIEWYNTKHFQEDIQHSQKLENAEEILIKHFKKFDKNLFNEITEEKFSHIKLDYEGMWANFFTRNVIPSFAKYLFTPKNVENDSNKEMIKKVLNSIEPGTLIIYLNNVKVNSLYKTAFLDNVDVFAKTVKNDCPVLTVGDYEELNLVKLLTTNNFKNLNEVLNYLNPSIYDVIEEEKVVEEEKNVENNIVPKDKDTLNMYWNEILESKNLDTTEDKDFFVDESDLLKTVTFKEPVDLVNIENEKKFKLSEHFNKFYDDSNYEDEKTYLKTLKEYKKNFKEFIKFFEEAIVGIKITSNKVDKVAQNNFRSKIFEKNFDELNRFLDSKNMQFERQLSSSFIELQDLLNFYSLYLKVKTSLFEIDFINANY